MGDLEVVKVDISQKIKLLTDAAEPTYIFKSILKRGLRTYLSEDDW